MNLLFLNHNLRDHGTYFRAFHLARELARLGHRATLWCASASHWYRSVRETVDGVSIVEAPSWNPLIGRDDGWGALDIVWRLGHLREEKWDLVYAFAHPPNVSLVADAARRLMGLPVVVDWCDVYRDGIFPLREEIRRYQGAGGLGLCVQRWAERREGRMERAVLRRASAVTVISDYLQDEARAAGVPEDRIMRFVSGAPLDTIRPHEKSTCRAALRSRGIHVSDDDLILGYVANYNPDERLLLAALREVFCRHPTARLLARCPEFTPSLVAQQGLEKKILRLERQPFGEMNHILGAADVLLLPLDRNVSNQGRWPNKFGDYIAAGRPVVTCAIGDVTKYFSKMGADSRRSEIGVLTDCDAMDFARGVSDLLEHPERLAPMGRAARLLAEEELAWSDIAARVAGFLAAVLDRHGKVK